jgi:hypothetical protein
MSLIPSSKVTVLARVAARMSRSVSLRNASDFALRRTGIIRMTKALMGKITLQSRALKSQQYFWNEIFVSGGVQKE